MSGETEARPGRVLSVQSAVVSGFVGQRVAVHALHSHSITTDALPTVALSNHTGYPHIVPVITSPCTLPHLEEQATADHSKDGELSRDSKIRENLLRVFRDGLERNGLATGYTHVLSGYVGSIGGLEALAEIVKSLKERHAERRKEDSKGGSNDDGIRFVCDPVMGDDGKLYVPESLVAVYRDLLVPLADSMFPNQTEIELLTGIAVRSQSDAFLAIDSLHKRGVATVIITSATLPEAPSNGAMGSGDGANNGSTGDHPSSGSVDQFITLLGSTMLGGAGPVTRFRMRIPRLDQAFTGTGDLFSALMVAWTHKGLSVVEACERTANTVFAIVQETHAAKSNELLLIEGTRHLLAPPSDLHIESWEGQIQE
jgi:pyridoxine kinase